MLRFLPVILIIGLSTFVHAQNKVDVSEWKKIRAIDKTAYIFAPLEMQVRIDSVTTDIGNVITVHHVLQQSTQFSPNFLFQFSYTLYPIGIVYRDSIDIAEDILSTTVENAVLMQNAELLYSAKKDFKDNPGRIWKTRYNDGAYVMKSEAYLADDRLYIIQVASVADTPTGDAVDHFLNSFRIVSSGPIE